MKSIERFGFVNAVLISDDCEIIAGHGRVEAAKMLGLKEVAVRLSNLSAAERRAYVITDNRMAELAGWDAPASERTEGAARTAVRRHRIDRVFARRDRPHARRGNGKQGKEARARGRTSGEQAAGPSRFAGGRPVGWGCTASYCGDARELTSYEFLLEGKQADSVLTGPPSNVAIEGRAAHDRVGDGNIAGGLCRNVSRSIHRLSRVIPTAQQGQHEGRRHSVRVCRLAAPLRADHGKP